MVPGSRVQNSPFWPPHTSHKSVYERFLGSGSRITAGVGTFDASLDAPVTSASKTGGGVEETERPEGGVGVW